MDKNFLYTHERIRDLKEMITAVAAAHPDKNAFLTKKDGEYKGTTYTEFKDDIDSLGTKFHQMGLKDSFIGIIGENRYEWCAAYYMMDPSAEA